MSNTREITLALSSNRVLGIAFPFFLFGTGRLLFAVILFPARGAPGRWGEGRPGGEEGGTNIGKIAYHISYLGVSKSTRGFYVLAKDNLGRLYTSNAHLLVDSNKRQATSFPHSPPPEPPRRTPSTTSPERDGD